MTAPHGPVFRANLPLALPGQTIGLLGGSFDPAHQGHLDISTAALRRFGIDKVWWLVSPGNPLKAHGPAPIPQRLAAARALVQNPRIEITALEAELGTRYTADTLARLRALWPQVRFVWLMGSDNLAQFHRWDRWQEIAAHHPIGILARPGSQLSARFSPAARAMEQARLPGDQSRLLAKRAAPAWCIAELPLNNASSSAIRARGGWKKHV